MDRRAFLATAVAAGGAVALGPALRLQSALGKAGLAPGDPYGPLQATPDGNGLLLPKGFTSRVVARGNAPVLGTTYVMPMWPDGANCFALGDGGWILVVNSEVPEHGGVS